MFGRHGLTFLVCELSFNARNKVYTLETVMCNYYDTSLFISLLCKCRFDFKFQTTTPVSSVCRQRMPFAKSERHT